MSSNLQKQVEAFAMENDVPSLTRLLVEWKECDSEWLLFVESRLCAPSTTPEQKSQLVAAKEQALYADPKLSIEDAVAALMPAAEELEPDKKSLEYSIAKSASSNETVQFPEEDQRNFEILQQLQEYDDDQFSELAAYIMTLDYENLIPAVQHKVNQCIYALEHSEDSEAQNKLGTTFINSSNYQAWYEKFVPESVLKNKDYSIELLMEYYQLGGEVGSIIRRDYQIYLQKRGEGLKDLSDFYSADRSEPCRSISEIEEFEERHQVIFPEALKSYFLNFLSDERYRNISPLESLSKIDYKLSDDRERYEHLKGMGIVHWLNLVWGNSHDHFMVEGGSLTQEQIDTLNQKYIGVGQLEIDPETCLILYYDAEHNFGALTYQQDDVDETYEYYLDLMLKKSPAQHTLFQLLTAIPQVLEIAEHLYYPSIQFFRSLRRLD